MIKKRKGVTSHIFPGIYRRGPTLGACQETKQW